jgi:phosphatidylethanolamine-binding protein (PEBP) family uncharacterized protein
MNKYSFFNRTGTCAVEKGLRKLPIIKIPESNMIHSSIAIIIWDKTANYYHGLYYNIPHGTKIVNLNTNKNKISFVESDRREFYSVPCPPQGTGEHEYYFKIYYLSKFAVQERVSCKEALISFIKKYTVDKKSFVQRFECPIDAICSYN